MAMAMYQRAGPEGVPADYGEGTATMLRNRELEQRIKFTEPAVFPEETQFEGGRPANLPEYYNKYGPAPAKYTGPSAVKERMVAREAIRQAATAHNQNRPDPITDDEVTYLQTMQDMAELADFDRWVAQKYDPRRPGVLPVLMGIYPEFVNRRIKQAHTDYEFAMRKQLIDTWGVQSFDDLHFLYLCDQGKISGPQLALPYAGNTGYTTGYLAPQAFKRRRNARGVRAPYASASVGASAADGDGWVMSDAGNPFTNSRSIGEMANAMFYESDINTPAALAPPNGFFSGGAAQQARQPPRLYGPRAGGGGGGGGAQPMQDR